MSQTRTLTLVVQHVGSDNLRATRRIYAAALREYARDAGEGLFERHVTKNGCRIDAVRSVPPSAGGVGNEFGFATAGTEALRARLLEMKEQIEFLPGGDHADSPVASIVGYDAVGELRKQIDEALAAIPGQPK